MNIAIIACPSCTNTSECLQINSHQSKSSKNLNFFSDGLYNLTSYLLGLNDVLFLLFFTLLVICFNQMTGYMPDMYRKGHNWND